MTEPLEVIVERRYRELLDDAKEPECKACGRKPMTPAQLTAALSGAVRYLATKSPTPNGGPAPGSALREDGDE